MPIYPRLKEKEKLTSLPTKDMKMLLERMFELGFQSFETQVRLVSNKVHMIALQLLDAYSQKRLVMLLPVTPKVLSRLVLYRLRKC